MQLWILSIQERSHTEQTSLPRPSIFRFPRNLNLNSPSKAERFKIASIAMGNPSSSVNASARLEEALAKLSKAKEAG